MTRLDAIVLDLDDTLLDTTGLLLPGAELRAVRAMRAAGLSFTDDEALARLAAHRAAGHALSAFRRLAAEATGGQAQDALARIGETAFLDYEVPPLDLEPRVAAALDALAAFAPLALFTLGVPTTQRAKVARLGIGPRFVAVAYADIRAGWSKTAALTTLLDDHSWSCAGVVVVGDSLAGDVAAAADNGCLAVHVRSGGERAHDAAPPGVAPWRTVDHVDEVAAILELAAYFKRPDVAS